MHHTNLLQRIGQPVPAQVVVHHQSPNTRCLSLLPQVALVEVVGEVVPVLPSLRPQVPLQQLVWLLVLPTVLVAVAGMVRRLTRTRPESL